MSVGKVECARKVLNRIRIRSVVGRFRNEDGVSQEITNIDLEVDDITEEVNNCKNNRWWYDFSGLLAPNIRLRTSIGVIIKFLQQ